MTLDDIVQESWSLAITHKADWYMDINPIVRDSKPKLKAAWQKVFKGGKPEENQKNFERFKLSIPALAKARSKQLKQTGKIPTPVGITVFVGNKRWEGCLEEGAEVKQKKAVVKCHCGEPVHGPKYDMCTHHLSRSYEVGRE